MWFWHPWLVSSWRRLFEPNRVRPAVNPAAMEAKGIRLQGERGISRQTTAQGMPGCSGLYLYARVRISLHLAHETAGASRRPAFPAPSDFWRANVEQASGATRRGNAKVYSAVIVRHCAPGRTIQYSRDSSDYYGVGTQRL